jgi:pimeloyl-ACP methyl ester carboxylesterase
MKKAYIDTPAGQVHFRLRDGKGTPIICLHQTASSSAMFDAFMNCYAGEEPIYALDTPGFGRSYDPDGQPDMRGYAQMLIDAIDALGIEGFHLFGHHTGASIGIEIADLQAERTKSLMMIGPVVLTSEEREQFATIYPKPFEPKADGSHLQEMWDYIKSIGPDISLELQHREMVDTARAWEGHIKVYSEIWNQDFASLYDIISSPMLIMCSPNDVLWPIFERAKENRPDVKVVELGGSNFQPDEVPDDLANAVKEFLTELNN